MNAYLALRSYISCTAIALLRPGNQLLSFFTVTLSPRLLITLSIHSHIHLLVCFPKADKLLLTLNLLVVQEQT